jgi:hypothetical protein
MCHSRQPQHSRWVLTEGRVVQGIADTLAQWSPLAAMAMCVFGSSLPEVEPLPRPPPPETEPPRPPHLVLLVLPKR